MPLTPGSLDLFGADKPDREPTWDELRDGTWMANSDEQRAVLRVFLNRGHEFSVALFASMHIAYAKHLAEWWESALPPERFSAAMREAQRLELEPQRVLDRLGYRRQSWSGSTTEEHLARLNQQAEEDWQRWLTVDIGDEEPAGSRETPLPAPEGRSLASLSSAAIKAVTGGKEAFSQGPIGRRARYIRLKAKKLGIPESEAEAMTPHRKDETIR